MHEQVLAGLVRSDEAEALIVAEPLNGSSCHGSSHVWCAADAEGATKQLLRASTTCLRPSHLDWTARTVAPDAQSSHLSPREKSRSGEKRVDSRTNPTSSAITRVQSPSGFTQALEAYQ